MSIERLYEICIRDSSYNPTVNNLLFIIKKFILFFRYQYFVQMEIYFCSLPPLAKIERNR